MIYRKTPRIVPRTCQTLFYFLTVPSGILCATVFFFPEISAPFSHNLNRDTDPRSRIFSVFLTGYKGNMHVKHACKSMHVRF
jgi:hypothetical protein